MQRPVVVAGVGMINFTKPGDSASYDEMGALAAKIALDDAGVPYPSIDQVYAGFVYGDSTCGQAAAYRLGLSGVPVTNVNNNCSTGSTALFLARQAVEFGAAECALAIGFEQMVPGALGDVFSDRPPPMLRQSEMMKSLIGDGQEPPAARYFGGAGHEYAEKHGIRPETFAKVSVKARKHAAQNPFAIFQQELTLDEVLASPTIYGPLTRYQCCPPTCGAAAAVICSDTFAKRSDISRTVQIKSQVMTTDLPSTFDDRSMIKLVGYDMAKSAATQAYENSGIDPEDIDVVELHDCFSTNEVLAYEALGLTEEGTAERFIEDGNNTYGGKVVTNPSGGLLSKGHPLGATGLAQCTELVWHLRHQAGARQVEGAKTALQHNLGLGGACVVTIYQN